MKKLFLRASAAIGTMGMLLSAAAARAATSTTSETVAWAIGKAEPVYNAGVDGGVTAATSMIPIYIGAAVILVVLGIAGYIIGRLTHWGRGVVHR